MTSSPSGDSADIMPQDWSGFFGSTQIRKQVHGPLNRYYGFKSDQWKSLLGKGSSLKTLGKDKLKRPDYGFVTEALEHFKSTPIYKHFLFFTQKKGETRHYRGAGREKTLAQAGTGFVGFDSQAEGQKQIDRVLGIFAKRRSEAAMKTRAPGRRATMLTTGY